VHASPDLEGRLDLLGAGARFECLGPLYRGGPEPLQAGPVYWATAQGGRSVPLLKVMMSNRCNRGCTFCAFRASRDLPRTSLEPHELAAAFDAMRRRGLVEGLFLSSGMEPDPVTAMSRMLDATAILRTRHGFRGYVHLKVLPGAERAQVEEAARLASRLSFNLEAPTAEHRFALAPAKSGPGLVRGHIEDLARLAARGGLPGSGWTTQYVVGPAGETDRDLLSTTATLYRRFSLRRAYYSRFEPVPGTPLEAAPPTATLRQRRLYEADTLLREYGFEAAEIPFEDGGSLPGEVDPKEAWARAHPERFPVDVATADARDLLRVPGLGPVGVRRLLRARREGALRSGEDLAALKVQVARCAGWITVGGRAVGPRPDAQIPLFGESPGA